MKNLKEIYSRITTFLNETNYTLDDIKLYEEMIYINEAYDLKLDERTINRLHSVATEYSLKYDGNPSMYAVARAILVYYDKSYDVDTFIQVHFNRYKFFELINEAMEG